MDVNDAAGSGASRNQGEILSFALRKIQNFNKGVKDNAQGCTFLFKRLNGKILPGKDLAAGLTLAMPTFGPRHLL